MTLNWSDFPDAPASGTVLCPVDVLASDRVVSDMVNGFPYLGLLVDGMPRVYVNACPHQFLPLDHRSDALLSADGRHFLCTNHAAVFRVEDGAGTGGEGIGCTLSAVPVTVRGDMVVVSG